MKKGKIIATKNIASLETIVAVHTHTHTHTHTLCLLNCDKTKNLIIYKRE